MDNRKKGCGYRTGSQDLPDGRLSRLKKPGFPAAVYPALDAGRERRKSPGVSFPRRRESTIPLIRRAV
ncbi:MAG: hypothetical protein CVU64_05675 [Deltaproteobacteria bacterium HGW-Deltaproteobacteria-21]|nr:MAG: hypothetical protein CVU64_05675 [Deltaproteobacteria bacterium HGW-Deltaproteobacteria-21]